MRLSVKQKEKKLKEYMVIRQIYSEQTLTVRQLARLFDKSPQWIWNIVTGRGVKALEELRVPDLIDPQRSKKN